ncbi:MAG: hypothetical protein ACFBSF_20955, partial [Leptolyngbyaceae cyanobacterium]
RFYRQRNWFLVWRWVAAKIAAGGAKLSAIADNFAHLQQVWVDIEFETITGGAVAECLPQQR